MGNKNDDRQLLSFIGIVDPVGNEIHLLHAYSYGVSSSLFFFLFIFVFISVFD